MGKCMRKIRPDHKGPEVGTYRKNKALLKKTCEVCALCGRVIDKSLKYPDPLSFTVDHIIPVQKGGRSTMDNLQPAHLICNKQKGTKYQQEVDAKNMLKNNDIILPQYFDWSSYSV